MAGVLLPFFIAVAIATQVLSAQGLHRMTPFFTKEQKKALLHLFLKQQNIPQTQKTLYCQKGWNLFVSPKEGIDIVKTFADKNVTVVTYEPFSKYWAVFPKPKSKDEIFLDSIEGGVVFFVLAKDITKIKLQPIAIQKPCSDIFHSKEYETLQDSGRDKGFVKNENGTFLAKSRYYAHHQRGLYQDTRVIVAIPKLKAKPSNHLYKYGPAIPKTYFLFTKEYEGKFFYVFSYHDKKCYKGILPSIRIPPFPLLKSFD